MASEIDKKYLLTAQNLADFLLDNFYSVSLKQSASRHGAPLGNIILLVFIKIATRGAMCQSRMLPSSYPIKLQLTYMKYNNVNCHLFLLHQTT
jgi:hypothetical protein